MSNNQEIKTVEANTSETIIISVADHKEISISRTDWRKFCAKLNSIRFSKAPDFNGIFIGLLIPAFIKSVYSICKTGQFDTYEIFSIIIILSLMGAYNILLRFIDIAKPTDNKINEVHIQELIQWADEYNERYAIKILSQDIH